MAFNRDTDALRPGKGKGYMTRADLDVISKRADESMRHLRRLFRKEFGEEGISGLERLLNLVHRGKTYE